MCVLNYWCLKWSNETECTYESDSTAVWTLFYLKSEDMWHYGSLLDKRSFCCPVKMTAFFPPQCIYVFWFPKIRLSLRHFTWGDFFNVEMERANALFLFLILISFSAHFQKKKNGLKRIMTTLLVFFFVVLNKLLNGGLQCLTYCIKCRLSLCLFISCDVCHLQWIFIFSLMRKRADVARIVPRTDQMTEQKRPPQERVHCLLYWICWEEQDQQELQKKICVLLKACWIYLWSE